MMAGSDVPPPLPLFIEADGRRLFALHHPTAAPARGSVLILPPFAEELNMSRRMLWRLGRALAAAGHAALLPDLAGTGESDGDFVDARWDRWQDDARAAQDWLRASSGAEPAILGLRAGALLAAGLGDALDRTPRLLVWQPVGSGQTMLNQFLRIRVAAGLMGGGEKETTQGLRADWAAGRTVEVAGYEIHPDLAAAVDGLSLAAMSPRPGLPVDWIEIGDEAQGAAPGSRRILDAWTGAGVTVTVRLCPGEAFWTIQESASAPAMIEATLAALRETADAP